MSLEGHRKWWLWCTGWAEGQTCGKATCPSLATQLGRWVAVWATVWSWKNNCFAQSSEAAGWCYTTCPMLPCREAEEPAASEAASCPESWCDCILCTFLYKGMQSVRWKTSSLPKIVVLLRTFRIIWEESSKEIQFWISHLFFSAINLNPLWLQIKVMEPFRKVNGEWVGRPRRGERKTPKVYRPCKDSAVGEIWFDWTFLVVN